MEVLDPERVLETLAALGVLEAAETTAGTVGGP
jgi:hypothetical protein